MITSPNGHPNPAGLGVLRRLWRPDRRGGRVVNDRSVVPEGVAAFLLATGAVAPCCYPTTPRMIRYSNSPVIEASRRLMVRADSPRLTVLDPHHRRPASRLPLRLDERQHVRLADLRGLLADHREEHLQVECGGQHRVRPRPGGDHVQEVVEQPMSQPRNPTSIGRANQAWCEHDNLPPTASAPTPSNPRRRAEDYPYIQTTRRCSGTTRSAPPLSLRK